MSLELRTTLFSRMEKFCQDSGMSPTRLGREVMSDPSFYQMMERGRIPTENTTVKMDKFIEEHRR